MKRRAYGSGTTRETSPGKWELRYRVPGEKNRRSETIEAKNQKAAEKELRDKIRAIEEKRLGPRLMMSALFDVYLKDQRKNEYAQAPLVELKINRHLLPFFGGIDAYALTPSDVDNYVDQRKKSTPKPKPRTINHELSILSRTLALAREKRIATVQLVINKLPGEAARQGFLEEEVFRAIVPHLPVHQIALFTLAYYTGIRAGELLRLNWSYVDFLVSPPLIKIPGEKTKNQKPRTIPLYHPEMIEALKVAYQSREPKCPAMFQFRGRRLKEYRQGWEDARAAAGYPNVLFHDTRRTAVRNFERGGVRRADARQITGHLTESVYVRYDIASEQGAFEAAEKMQKYHAEQASRKIRGKLGENNDPPSTQIDSGITGKSFN